MDTLADLNGKTVAITGANGYIGSALVDGLAKYSTKILRVSRQKLMPREGMRTMRADVCTLDCWLEIVAQADIIFHLAGNTSAYTASINPAESLNSTLLPVTHLIRAAQELKRHPRVVFASTATVYGLTAQLPVDESVEPKPITVYDLHKLFAEQQLALSTQQGILESISLRLANVYGPSSSISSADDRGILNRVAAMALQGKDIRLYGDGNYLRDYIYINDVVNAFFAAGVTQGLGGVAFNVASGIGTTVKHAFELVANRVARVTGQRIRINCFPWPANVAPIEFRNFVASNASFVSATGWRSVISLDEGAVFLISEYMKRKQS